jgi:hypothetical protein
MQIIDMMKDVGLKDFTVESYRVPSSFSEWINRCFFESEETKQAFLEHCFEDVESGENRLDLNLRKVGNDLEWSFMNSIIVGKK